MLAITCIDFLTEVLKAISDLFKQVIEHVQGVPSGCNG